jgi:two-component system, NtrC family, response regulator
MARLLIIDDDPQICQLLTLMAQDMGHEATEATTLEHGLSLSLSNDYDLILLDLEFPQGNGLQVLPDLLKVPSKPEVIIITGSGVKGAELAFKYGAWDYVQKPFFMQELSLPISRALQYREEKETAKTPVTLKRSGIIGSSQAINSCLESVAKASVTEASVLITGETGTGKELFAKAIHENSRRSSSNFIVVDCGSLPETLAESILFGYEKGAFTGADKKREGLLEQTEGGTLFLDEIGDLPFNIQKSLLRALQEKSIRPLGAKQELSVDFRLVAATNRNLDKMVKESSFREDLLFRIRAIEIRLPSLRDRSEDIQEITINKIHRLCQQYGMGIKGISHEFLEILNAQNWPGNVRELINVLEYSLASAGQDPTLIPKHIPYQYRTAILKNGSFNINGDVNPGVETKELDHNEFPSLAEYRNRIEKNYLHLLLGKVKGDRDEACILSGMSQSQLYALLKKHKLSRFRP